MTFRIFHGVTALGRGVDLGQGKLPARPNRKGRTDLSVWALQFALSQKAWSDTFAVPGCSSKIAVFVAVGLVCWVTRRVGVWSTAVPEWIKNKVCIDNDI